MIINIAVGFDQKEAVAYHTFCQSVLEKATQPVAFLPLCLNSLPGYREIHQDGSNSFVYSRFLTPWVFGFNGSVIFADGDMVCLSDITKLWSLRDPSKAVQVVQHNYKTKFQQKYLGAKNLDYPRKNWSSLIIWNCEHPKNKLLTPDFVMSQSGAFLHRFSWLSDDDIGALPLNWNWLVAEYEDNYDANLLHFTLGTPCFLEYQKSNMSSTWHQVNARSNEGVGV